MSEQTTQREYDLEQLKTATPAELRDLAAAHGLPADGTAAEVRKRLRAKKLGGDQRFVRDHTLCPSCRHVVAITSTLTSADGTQYRRFKCPGCGLRDKFTS